MAAETWRRERERESGRRQAFSRSEDLRRKCDAGASPGLVCQSPRVALREPGLTNKSLHHFPPSLLPSFLPPFSSSSSSISSSSSTVVSAGPPSPRPPHCNPARVIKGVEQLASPAELKLKRPATPDLISLPIIFSFFPLAIPTHARERKRACVCVACFFFFLVF